ncbi:MAG TPA: 3-phosphoshikimate 1-carboxyvinyltransferase [Actinomycetota bacterium]|nr:3-phosphoshikimate 1-carboxyvinyltransferase [Actinomycetota bacterium]
MTPRGTVGGEARVPGDKSIAHRWLLMAATAEGRSHIDGLPRSLDIASTAACLSQLVPPARPALDAWGSSPSVTDERHGSTWNRDAATLDLETLDLRGEGRRSLLRPERGLDCGNSGTTMRLLAGLVSSSPFDTVLEGDPSLSTRPMERVAAPLRAMGADVTTSEGHPPLTIRGSALRGIRFEPEVPSAQVKGAVLMAGLAAEGPTTVTEPVATRDHTERLFRALGAPIRARGSDVVLEGPFQHKGFRGAIPGDPSSAAFLLGAAALTGGNLTISGVGLNPTRLRVLDVLGRMGLEVEVEVEGEELGEPVGTMRLGPRGTLRPVHVDRNELPLVIDEVPVLAVIAAHADGPSRFEGAGELRVKESDRLSVLAAGIRAMGGEAAEEGDDLVVGGGGLGGGTAEPAGDHRMAMALTVTALAARAPVEIDAVESASVSFPGFFELLRSLGADVEVSG